MKLLVTAVTLFAAILATAASNVTTRIDTSAGKTTQTIIANLPQSIEVWAVGINAFQPMYRIGKFEPVSKDVRIGLYIGEKAGDVFVTPAIAMTPRLGTGKVFCQMEYQRYLNANTRDSFSVPEARILWPVAKNIEFGPVANGSFQQGKAPKLFEGLATKVQLSKELGFYARWCPLGDGESLRTQLTYNF